MAQDTVVDEKILDRIKRLLEMAEGLDNPVEAASYAAKATALIQQYNVDQDALHGNDKTHNYVLEKYPLAGTATWHGALFHVISDAHFCRSIKPRKGRRIDTGSILVVGEKHNIEVSVYLYNYLARLLKGMARAAYKASKSVIPADRWQKSFILGAVDTIARRLQEQRASFEAAVNTNRALVVVKDADLAQAMSEYFARGTNPGRRLKIWVTPYDEGKEAAETIELRQGVGTVDESLLLQGARQ